MVLIPHPYKEDRELEEELRENDRGRTIFRQICLPDSLFKPYLDERHVRDNITKEVLLKRMEMQEQQIRYLLKTVQLLKQDQEIEQPKVVIIEEVSKEEGKTLVEEYFKVHECADIEELMLNLKIPVKSIVEIIDELQKEGKIAPKGETET